LGKQKITPLEIQARLKALLTFEKAGGILKIPTVKGYDFVNIKTGKTLMKVEENIFKEYQQLKKFEVAKKIQQQPFKKKRQITTELKEAGFKEIDLGGGQIAIQILKPIVKTKAIQKPKIKLRTSLALGEKKPPINLGVSSETKSGIYLFQKVRLEPIPKFKTRFTPLSVAIQKQKARVSIFQEQKQEQLLRQEQAVSLLQAQAVLQAPAQAVGQAVLQAPEQITEQMTELDFFNPQGPRPPRPRPPRPEGKEERFLLGITKEETKAEGYDILIKRKQLKERKGKYKSRGYEKANTEPLTKEGALGLGASIVDTFANRSFTIRKANKKAVLRRDLELKWRLLNEKFRRSKSNQNVVEKSTYAIDSMEEKKGIPYEATRLRKLGLLDLKRRKSNLIIKNTLMNIRRSNSFSKQKKKRKGVNKWL
jgi:hypothetical protein